MTLLILTANCIMTYTHLMPRIRSPTCNTGDGVMFGVPGDQAHTGGRYVVQGTFPEITTHNITFATQWAASYSSKHLILVTVSSQAASWEVELSNVSSTSAMTDVRCMLLSARRTHVTQFKSALARSKVWIVCAVPGFAAMCLYAMQNNTTTRYSAK